MPPDRNLRLWQARVDRDFPEGLLASWDDPGGPQATYPIPRVEVIAMVGLDPHVLLPCDDWGRTIDGIVVAYTTDQTEPCLVMRVGFGDSPGRDMLWSAGVGPALAARLVPVREKLIRLARERGGSSLAPAPPGT